MSKVQTGKSKSQSESVRVPSHVKRGNCSAVWALAVQHMVICIKVNVMVIFILSDLSNIDNLQ